MSKKILIGSLAAKLWFSDFRKTSDIDWLSLDERPKNICTIAELPGYKWIVDNEGLICSPSTLYTMKVSHSFWDVHWTKTMKDILFFQSKNVDFNPKLYSLLYQDCCKLHGNKKAYLKKSNDDFFKDGVKRQYKHDDLHRMMAFGDTPLYEKCKKNISSAYISESMFNSMPELDRNNMFLEELYVTIIERFYLTGSRVNLGTAMDAFKLLITSMTKGWFPLFGVLNFSRLYSRITDEVKTLHEKFETRKYLYV